MESFIFPFEALHRLRGLVITPNFAIGFQRIHPGEAHISMEIIASVFLKFFRKMNIA